MNDQPPISCHIHDYIEIACLYQIRIELKIKGSDPIQGTARTTRTSQQRREYLVIDTARGQQEIELLHIEQMRALTVNPHFDEIDF